LLLMHLPVHAAPRAARLVLTLAFALAVLAPAAGCMRLGFSEPPDATAAADGPRDAGKADAPADGAYTDATLAGLNEPCTPGGCVPGLVCTGTLGSLHCRPACGDGGCPDSEICGRPTGAPTVPMACLSNQTAGLYGDCSAMACATGLRCLKGPSGSACFEDCVT